MISAIGFSLLFACATPFAALATVAALSLSRRDGYALIGLTWAMNQAIGFGFLNYPHDLGTYGWGLAIGFAAFSGYALGCYLATRIRPALVAWPIVLLGAFAGYEAVLLVASTVLPGGSDALAPAIVGGILAINAAALLGFCVLEQLANAVRSWVRTERRPEAALT